MKMKSENSKTYISTSLSGNIIAGVWVFRFKISQFKGNLMYLLMCLTVSNIFILHARKV